MEKNVFIIEQAHFILKHNVDGPLIGIGPLIFTSHSIYFILSGTYDQAKHIRPAGLGGLPSPSELNKEFNEIYKQSDNEKELLRKLDKVVAEKEEKAIKINKVEITSCKVPTSIFADTIIIKTQNGRHNFTMTRTEQKKKALDLKNYLETNLYPVK